jgi:PilZ domain
MLGRGWLYDISEKGARFFLDHILEEGRRVSLEVDFRNQYGEVTGIRFPAIIRRIAPGDLHEIAVCFLKGESYIRRKGTYGKRQDSPWSCFAKGNNWIN